MFTRMFTGKYLQVNVSCSATQQHASPGLPASPIACLPLPEPHFYKLKESTKTFHLLQFIFIAD